MKYWNAFVSWFKLTFKIVPKKITSTEYYALSPRERALYNEKNVEIVVPPAKLWVPAELPPGVKMEEYLQELKALEKQETKPLEDLDQDWGFIAKPDSKIII